MDVARPALLDGEPDGLVVGGPGQIGDIAIEVGGQPPEPGAIGLDHPHLLGRPPRLAPVVAAEGDQLAVGRNHRTVPDTDAERQNAGRRAEGVDHRDDGLTEPSLSAGMSGNHQRGTVYPVHLADIGEPGIGDSDIESRWGEGAWWCAIERHHPDGPTGSWKGTGGQPNPVRSLGHKIPVDCLHGNGESTAIRRPAELFDAEMWDRQRERDQSAIDGDHLDAAVLNNRQPA